MNPLTSQSSPSGGAQWYYQGRGALAHEDWSVALESFVVAIPRLHTDAQWWLLWHCLLAHAATAWRVGDGMTALQSMQDAHAVAEQLDDDWPRIWTFWVLGHLHAAHSLSGSAGDCFVAAQHLLGTTADQLMLGLTTTAAALCAEHRRGSQSLAEQLFGLLRMSFQRAQSQGLPLDALYGLPSPPLFAPPLADDSPSKGSGLFARLRNLLATEPANDLSLPQQVFSSTRKQPVSPTKSPDRPLPMATEQETLPSLQVFCLGRFDVLVDDRTVTHWNGTKSKTLFKLLLTAYPHPVPCAKLMHAMWPEVDEDLARQRLHTVVSDLRRVLKAIHPAAGALIHSQPGGYALNRNFPIWIDVQAFSEAHVAGQHYEALGRIEEAQRAYAQAVELYRGYFLEEDLYEDWPVEQRERLKNACLEMLTHLAQWAFAAEDYAVCIHWGEHILACDPCREDIHRQLMHCYSRLRQRPQALRQYQQCVKALRYLDAVPESETEELHRRLQRGQEI